MADDLISISIFKRDFERLKQHAEPFIDSPASVISRILDAFEKRGAESNSISSENAGARKFSALALPNLTHTRLIGGHFNGEPPEKPQWDSLYRIALRQLYDSVKNVPIMREISGANISEKIKKVHGYRPFLDRPFSYQGQSAEDIAKYVIRIAKYLKVDAELQFEWRDKLQAAFPGERGVINVVANDPPQQ